MARFPLGSLSIQSGSQGLGSAPSPDRVGRFRAAGEGRVQ
jgi:hypothetical protein